MRRRFWFLGMALVMLTSASPLLSQTFDQTKALLKKHRLLQSYEHHKARATSESIDNEAKRAHQETQKSLVLFAYEKEAWAKAKKSHSALQEQLILERQAIEQLNAQLRSSEQRTGKREASP